MTVGTEGTETRPQTIIYVDGFNLYYGAVRSTRYKWLDLEAMCRSLLRRDQIVKIRYFTARVNDRPDDPQLASRQGTYLRALATLPLVEVHYGHFLTRAVRLPRVNRRRGQSRTIKVLRTEEKGSDVNLATFLLLDAFKGRCDTAVVVSNDSDLAQAIQVTQSDLGVKVGIVNPHSRKSRSRKLLGLDCLFYKQISSQVLAETQLPTVVYDSNGSIHKPEGW